MQNLKELSIKYLVEFLETTRYPFEEHIRTLRESSNPAEDLKTLQIVQEIYKTPAVDLKLPPLQMQPTTFLTKSIRKAFKVNFTSGAKTLDEATDQDLSTFLSDKKNFQEKYSGGGFTFKGPTIPTGMHYSQVLFELLQRLFNLDSYEVIAPVTLDLGEGFLTPIVFEYLFLRETQLFCVYKRLSNEEDAHIPLSKLHDKHLELYKLEFQAMIYKRVVDSYNANSTTNITEQLDKAGNTPCETFDESRQGCYTLKDWIMLFSAEEAFRSSMKEIGSPVNKIQRLSLHDLETIDNRKAEVKRLIDMCAIVIQDNANIPSNLKDVAEKVREFDPQKMMDNIK